MTPQLPPNHPLSRRASPADVMALAADLSVIDRIEAALTVLDRPRPRSGLFGWLLGRR